MTTASIISKPIPSEKCAIVFTENTRDYLVSIYNKKKVQICMNVIFNLENCMVFSGHYSRWKYAVNNASKEYDEYMTDGISGTSSDYNGT